MQKNQSWENKDSVWDADELGRAGVCVELYCKSCCIVEILVFQRVAMGWGSLVFVPWPVTLRACVLRCETLGEVSNSSEMFIIHITDEETEAQVGPESKQQRWKSGNKKYN